MKRILATTALVMILSGGAAYAEMGNYTSQPTDINASQFIGQRIYAADTMPADSVQPGAEKDWDDVGEINDVVLDRSGQVKAVVLGVGGFLGMGEKAVAVPMTDVKFVKNGDGADDFFLVVNTNKEALAAAPAFISAEDKANQQAAANDAATSANPAAVPTDTATDTTMTAPADTTADATAAKPADTTADATAAKPADTTADATAAKPADTTTAMDNSAATTDQTTTAADTTAEKPADTTTAMDNNAATDQTTTSSTTTANSTQAMTDENRARLTRPEITREGYQSAQANELTADKLTGARVYGPNDEDVGEINRIILDNNGQVERVVLDVGGFLGMGERQIAVTMDELNIVKNAKGDDFRVYIDANQANLKAQPEFKG
jgi:sporulation protein YlmC with PRC-barrel domain